MLMVIVFGYLPSISIAEYENVSISLNAFENVWWGDV